MYLMVSSSSHAVAIPRLHSPLARLVSEVQQPDETSIIVAIPGMKVASDFVVDVCKKVQSSVLSYFYGYTQPNGTQAVSVDRDATFLRPQYSIAKDFWESQTGKALTQIITSLQEHGLLSPEKAERLKENCIAWAKQEGLNIGEATANLLKMSGTQVHVQQASVALGVFHFIKKQILLELEDLRFTNAGMEFDINEQCETGKKEIALLIDSIKSPEHNIGVIQEKVATILGRIDEEVEKKRHGKREISEKMSLCQTGLKALQEIEKREFRKEDIELVSAKIHEKADTVMKDLITAIQAREPRYLRCTILTPQFAVQDVVTAQMGERNVLFVPRVGAIEFASKKAIAQSLDEFIKGYLPEKKCLVEITLWGKQSPQMPPRFQEESSRLMQIEEVREPVSEEIVE